MANTSNPIMRFFNYDHLPEGNPKYVSRQVSELAHSLNEQLPDCAEKTAGLRKLLEAKDCFVRTALDA